MTVYSNYSFLINEYLPLFHDPGPREQQRMRLCHNNNLDHGCLKSSNLIGQLQVIISHINQVLIFYLQF